MSFSIFLWPHAGKELLRLYIESTAAALLQQSADKINERRENSSSRWCCCCCIYITKREKYVRSALIARLDLCALPAGQRRSQSAARGRRVPYKEKKNSFVNIIWIRVVIMAQTVSECAVKVSWSHQDRKIKEIKKGFYLWNVYSSLEFFGSFHHPVEQINITKKKNCFSIRQTNKTLALCDENKKKMQ